MRILAAILFVLVLLGLTGCTYRLQPPLTELTAPDEILVNDRDIRIITHVPASEAHAPDVLVIPDVQIASEFEGDPLAIEIAKSMTEKLRFRAMVQFRHSEIILDDENHPDLSIYRRLGKQIHVLRATITRLEKGNGSLRYFIGFGAGDSQMEWAGTIEDLDTGLPICSFVAGYRTGGDPTLGWNFKVFSGRYCLRKSQDPLVKRTVWELQPFL